MYVHVFIDHVAIVTHVTVYAILITLKSMSSGLCTDQHAIAPLGQNHWRFTNFFPFVCTLAVDHVSDRESD